MVFKQPAHHILSRQTSQLNSFGQKAYCENLNEIDLVPSQNCPNFAKMFLFTFIRFEDIFTTTNMVSL